MTDTPYPASGTPRRATGDSATDPGDRPGAATAAVACAASAQAQFYPPEGQSLIFFLTYVPLRPFTMHSVCFVMSVSG